jgi:hypothetical protein
VLLETEIEQDAGAVLLQAVQFCTGQFVAVDPAPV